MAEVTVEVASSLKQILEAIHALTAAWRVHDEAIGRAIQTEYWFRGVDNNAYELLPGLYRSGVKRDEVTLVEHFRAKAPMYLENEPLDDWDWYFMVQHYGIPTRLLDWTENLVVALYFAVVQPFKDRKMLTSPCVWLLDPCMVNRLTLGIQDDQVISPRGEFSKQWLPTNCVPGAAGAFEYDGCGCWNELPMAILPRRANPRIHVQQGMFTVHGSEIMGLERVFDGVGEEEHRIARIDLYGDLEQLVRDLVVLGATPPAIFPELQQVAAHIRATY
jgi:hypothetical protein